MKYFLSQYRKTEKGIDIKSAMLWKDGDSNNAYDDLLRAGFYFITAKGYQSNKDHMLPESEIVSIYQGEIEVSEETAKRLMGMPKGKAFTKWFPDRKAGRDLELAKHMNDPYCTR